MSAGAHSRGTPPSAVVLVAAGLAVVFLAWMIPVSLKSISPSLLRAAGEGTPSLASFGRDLVDAEKIGPASFFLTAARATKDPRAPALARALDELSARQPSLVAWGGWDPFLDPLFDLRAPSGLKGSTPVLSFFVREKAREALRTYLTNSGSLGVQAILRTREVPGTGRFVPANRPGGQPLDAVILLTALLYQGEHLSPGLQREVRALAEEAVSQKYLGDLEGFYMDILSLGRRLDWTQLSELLRVTDSVKTTGEYAHLARVAWDQMPFVYSAALMTNSADRVASYLIDFGKAGAEDLKLALAGGRGAVRLLVERQVPVSRSRGPTLSAASELVLEQPNLMLALKYLGYLFGVFLVLRGLDSWVISPALATNGMRQHARAGALAVVLAGLLVVMTEPYLLKAMPASEYRVQLRMPILASLPSPSASHTVNSPTVMQSSTLISIGIFAALQVVMYFICLRKIAEIDAREDTPMLKLRLMENEENLFDSGLYVGMMGTAAALVLQVLGVIEPNLLAAYSSNLFGIVCVAFVKIRHVRGYRRRLILQAQEPDRGRRAGFRFMNKTLLLFIVDFLFLNLIALTRWEKATPTRTSQPPVPQVASNAATKDQDLVEVMRESLADEQAARQNLAQELATQSGTLSQRERSLAQAAAERAHLAASLAEDQKAQADLSQKFAAASHQATLTREQLERLQHELDEKRTETDRQKRQLAELEKQQAFSHKQIEGLTVAVMVDEQEKKNLQGEAVQLQGQVQNERAERLEVEHAATQLAQGVGQLAQNSGELSKEIRENRPINANVLFDDFLNNRVEATVELRRRGLLGQSVHSRAAPMVLTTDGHQVYAVAYGGDVGFSLDQIGTDWEKLQISLARPPAAPSVAGELRFLAVDPRVIAIPVEPAQVSALGAKVYPLAQDRFKFPEAVLIDAKGKGYGDVGFKLDPDHPGYVRVDNHLLKHLLGDFAPSPGDLVMSKSGELLGVMVNRDYCALMGNFSPIAALHAGDIASEHSGAIVDSLGARVRAMPYELQ